MVGAAYAGDKITWTFPDGGVSTSESFYIGGFLELGNSKTVSGILYINGVDVTSELFNIVKGEGKTFFNCKTELGTAGNVNSLTSITIGTEDRAASGQGYFRLGYVYCNGMKLTAPNWVWDIDGANTNTFMQPNVTYATFKG